MRRLGIVPGALGRRCHCIGRVYVPRACPGHGKRRVEGSVATRRRPRSPSGAPGNSNSHNEVIPGGRSTRRVVAVDQMSSLRARDVYLFAACSRPLLLFPHASPECPREALVDDRGSKRGWEEGVGVDGDVDALQSGGPRGAGNVTSHGEPRLHLPLHLHIIIILIHHCPLSPHLSPPPLCACLRRSVRSWKPRRRNPCNMGMEEPVPKYMSNSRRHNGWDRFSQARRPQPET